VNEAMRSLIEVQNCADGKWMAGLFSPDQEDA